MSDEEMIEETTEEFIEEDEKNYLSLKQKLFV